MNEVFIGFIEDEKYGKLAKYMDETGNIIIYRIIKVDENHSINEEISINEYNELLSRMEGDNLL